MYAVRALPLAMPVVAGLSMVDDAALAVIVAGLLLLVILVATLTMARARAGRAARSAGAGRRPR
jgi:hypothetical protein